MARTKKNLFVDVDNAADAYTKAKGKLSIESNVQSEIRLKIAQDVHFKDDGSEVEFKSLELSQCDEVVAISEFEIEKLEKFVADFKEYINAKSK